eukprot:139664-Alexandrium_andersonii.AAC.1
MVRALTGVAQFFSLQVWLRHAWRRPATLREVSTGRSRSLGRRARRAVPPQPFCASRAEPARAPNTLQL